MTRHVLARRRRWAALVAVVSTAVIASLPLAAQPAAATTYVPISGVGSTWSFTAIDAWTKNVAQYGMDVSYNPLGSTTGRNEF